MKIQIWHAVQHEDGDVTELEVSSLHRFIQQSKLDGGFFKGTHAENNLEFIPWHCVSYVKQIAEPAPEAAPEENQNAAEEGEESQSSQ